MRPSVSGDFPRQQGVQEFALCEGRLKADARRGARQLQKIGRLGPHPVVHGEDQAQLIEQRFHLPNAEILDEPIFKPIEGSASDPAGRGQLRLG